MMMNGVDGSIKTRAAEIAGQRRAQHSIPKRVALKLAVVLVVFGVQINLVAVDFPLMYAVFYSTLLVCLLVTLGGRIRLSTLASLMAMMSVTAFSGNPLKGLGLGVGAYLGYIAVKEYEADYRRIMIWLLAVNTVIVVIQFLGVWEIAYLFSDYGNEALPVSLTAVRIGVSGFLPQMRPSGIFPSPTYVSAFCVLLYSTVVVFPKNKGRVSSLCAGLFFALLGSTVGLVLAICSVPLMFGIRALRYLVYGYVISIVLYATYFPAQFAYNFSVNDFITSFASRLDVNNVSSGSVLERNALVAVVLCFMGLVFFWFAARSGSLAMLVPPGCGLAMPILVHDITFSLLYWFLMGAVVARVLNDRGLRRLAKSFKHGQKPSIVPGAAP